MAEGTADDPILFTATDTLGLYDSATVAGGWHGIHLLSNENGHAKFKHCRFEYGKANVPGSWYGNQGFYDTISGNQGGAFRIIDYNSIEFSHCTFSNNYARSMGGGIYCHFIDSITIYDCLFEKNKVLVNGGAVFCGSHQSLVVDNSMFKLNSAWSKTLSGSIFCHGSAIYLHAYPPNPHNIIKNNFFFNNSSLSTMAIFTSASFVCNNLFTNNYNQQVFTFNMLESSHVAINNIMANNYYDSGIPGVFNFSENLRFYNNIMWNNFSDDIDDDDMALTWFSTQPDVQYCLVWEGRIDGTNIITNDPLFVDPAPNYGLESNGWEYDWSLSDSSPAVNAGTPDTNGLNLPQYDLAGNPRVFGIRIDMGAYENQVVTGLPQNPLVSAKIKAAPNPFRNRFSINILPENKIDRITIRNQSGIIIKKMEQFPMSGWLVIDLQFYKTGLYVIMVEYANGTVEVKKMLKI